MSNLYFGGQQIKRPGAYSIVDTSNMIPITLGAFNILCYVGTVGTVVADPLTATVPIPKNTVSYFNQPSTARKAIGSSDLMDCLDISWRHGADLIGVSPVTPTGTIPAWSPAHTYSVGNVVAPSVANTHCYICIQAGTSSSSEPVWTLVTGAIQPVDGTAKWQEYGAPSLVASDNDWQAAIDLLEREDVDVILLTTTAPAIHVKLMTHVGAMSTTKMRKERRAMYGHANGMAVDDIALLQVTYNSERALLASPGVYTYDDAGDKVLSPSYFLAAAYAGIWASQEPQEPITYKYVTGFAGLETLYNGVEIEQLLDAHIAVTEYVKNKGYRIVQGMTTSSSADITQNEWSVSVLKDVMSMDLRDYFEEKYVGKAGIKGIEVTIYNDLVTMLEKFITNGYITAYTKDSVKVIKDATSFYLEYEANPTLPINNILITSHFTL